MLPDVRKHLPRAPTAHNRRPEVPGGISVRANGTRPAKQTCPRTSATHLHVSKHIGDASKRVKPLQSSSGRLHRRQETSPPRANGTQPATESARWHLRARQWHTTGEANLSPDVCDAFTRLQTHRRRMETCQTATVNVPPGPGKTLLLQKYVALDCIFTFA